MASIVKRIVHDEYQYIDLIKRVLSDGCLQKGRNGNTISYFGSQMRFNLRDGALPFMTTKRLAWKTCLRELLWFIRGDTSNIRLQEKGVKIWNANATREFLDAQGLTDNKEGDLGPVYGHQWRFFNAKYNECDTDYRGNGVDQLQYVIDALKRESIPESTHESCCNGRTTTENMFSRRLIVSAWNPEQLNEMALPPCHVLFQFYVNPNKELSCSLYQRSGDIGLGVPFNIASYAMLTHLIAHHCGLKTGELVHTIGDNHIYEEHVDVLKEQITREPLEFPTLSFRYSEPYDDINSYTEEDFVVEGYKHHGTMKMEMKA